MILKQRADSLYRQLDRELLNFTAGSRFYSARQLVLRYGVSHRVVTASLRELEKRGAIEIRPQSGIFVRRSYAKRRVMLYVADWPSESIRLTVEAFQRCFEACGDLYDFQRVFYEADSNPLDRIMENAADFSMVIWSKPYLEPDDVVKLASMPKPVVMLWHDYSGISIHSAHSAGEYGGMLAAGHLIHHGHRKLAVLPSEPGLPDVRSRINGFLDTARIFRASAIVIDCPVVPGNYSPTCAHDALAAHLAKHGCDFTGLFVVSDESAQGASAALAEYGLAVPRDVSMVGFGNVMNSGYFNPPLTTIDGRREEVVRRVVQEIHAHLSGTSQELINIRVKPVLVERASVRTISRTQRKERA
ncbi:MAG: substrate-binding domain-containing protein [Lentisphaeria bacterium]|nr:substrate-binding domain-containing protein [Lentisphaeria bacterium]